MLVNKNYFIFSVLLVFNELLCVVHGNNNKSK